MVLLKQGVVKGAWIELGEPAKANTESTMATALNSTVTATGLREKKKSIKNKDHTDHTATIDHYIAKDQLLPRNTSISLPKAWHKLFPLHGHI